MSFITDFTPKNFLRQWAMLLSVWIGIGLLIVVLLCDERSDIESSEKALLSYQAHIIHDNLSRQLDAIDQALKTLLQEVPVARIHHQEAAQLNSRSRYSGVAQSEQSGRHLLWVPRQPQAPGHNAR